MVGLPLTMWIRVKSRCFRLLLNRACKEGWHTTTYESQQLTKHRPAEDSTRSFKWSTQRSETNSVPSQAPRCSIQALTSILWTTKMQLLFFKAPTTCKMLKINCLKRCPCQKIIWSIIWPLGRAIWEMTKWWSLVRSSTQSLRRSSWTHSPSTTSRWTQTIRTALVLKVLTDIKALRRWARSIKTIVQVSLSQARTLEEIAVQNRTSLASPISLPKRWIRRTKAHTRAQAQLSLRRIWAQSATQMSDRTIAYLLFRRGHLDQKWLRKNARLHFQSASALLISKSLNSSEIRVLLKTQSSSHLTRSQKSPRQTATQTKNRALRRPKARRKKRYATLAPSLKKNDWTRCASTFTRSTTSRTRKSTPTFAVNKSLKSASELKDALWQKSKHLKF